MLSRLQDASTGLYPSQIATCDKAPVNGAPDFQNPNPHLALSSSANSSRNMSPSPEKAPQRCCQRVIEFISLLAMVIGALVLLGWAFDLNVLKTAGVGDATMKPNAALSFLLSGVALWSLASSRFKQSPQDKIGYLCAGVVSAIAWMTLAQYLFHVNVGIDTLLYPAIPVDLHDSHPGRMAPATAVAFVLLSTAIGCMKGAQSFSAWISQSAALGAVLIGFIATLGYLYGVEDLYRFYSYAAVAFPTALLFVLLGLGVMLARTDHGFAATLISHDSGGFMARRILPAAILLPLVIGWLRQQGEHAGYYGPGLGLAWFTAANIALFVFLVWFSARSLNRKDAEGRGMQQALQQSEQRLQNIMDGLGPNIFVGLLSLDGAVLEANKQALAAAGLRREDVLNKPVEETYWFSYSEASKRQMRDMVMRAAQGEATRCDLQIRAKDDQFIHLDFSLQPYRNAAGEVTQLVPSSIVITERKHAEAALRQRDERVQLITQATNDVVWDWDLEADTLWWNEAYTKLFGYPAQGRLGIESWTGHLHRDDAARVINSIYAVIHGKGQYWSHEYRFQCHDGRYAYILDRGYVIRDANGKGVRMLGAMQDITARKQAEKALRQSEGRLRLALDAAHMGTFDWDIPNNHFTWSHWHEVLWGLEPGEFVGTFEAVAQRIHADDMPRLIAEFDRCIALRKPFTCEFRVIWPDGSTHWIASRGEFNLTAGGQALRMRGAVVEITERKQAENALRQLTQQLEQGVIERTGELQATQRELSAKNQELQAQYRRVQEANRLKSEFLANMSHELRTPLNAIIGFSELMHDGKTGPVSDQQKEYLGDVLSSAHHLLQLINDVLDLAKVESGKMEFHYAYADLRKIIGEVSDVLRTLTSRTGMKVVVQVDPRLRAVLVDTSKMKQVLYNYLSNALKFSAEGGQVDVRAKPIDANTYCIEVEDYGIGISQEDIPRLFTEFQQLDLSTSKKYPGTGLGLALTKRMIEAQGGTVGVSSVSGKGSIFYVTLPWKNDEAMSNHAA